MIDMPPPDQTNVVHECAAESSQDASQHEIEIFDLSLQDALAAGLCSGSASSIPIVAIEQAPKADSSS